jgi:hypothetical protein
MKQVLSHAAHPPGLGANVSLPDAAACRLDLQMFLAQPHLHGNIRTSCRAGVFD